MASKKTPAKQEVQEVTKSTPAAGDQIRTAEGTASKQLLKKTAEFYGIPEEEATLEMAFNMMYSQDIDRTAEKITKGKSAEKAKQAADKIITAAKEITGKNDLTWAELSEICREKTAPLNEKLEAIKSDPTLKKSVETTTNAINKLEEYIKSEEFKRLQKGIKSIQTTIRENREYFAEISKRAKELYNLIPFMQIVIAENYPGGITVDDVLEQCSISGEPETDTARDILEKARQRATDYEESQNIVEQVAETILELPQITISPTTSLDYPLDKPNSTIWNLLTVADPSGQLRLDIDTSRKGSGKEALIYYSIDFNELENSPELNITKKLTPFDKRVYIIAAALLNAGNEVITATQIYKADHDTEPNEKDIKKINDSLTKMGAAHVYIDNKQEVTINKKYPEFKYDASLLPFERISAYINGQLSETAIHLLREPPLITFAKKRKQITTIDRQVLLAPISKTDANLRIEDYLIERISHMKSPHSKAPRKLLYVTIYEKCGITEKKQKQRAPEKIRRFLDYYAKCGLIKSYTETKEGVTIVL